MKVGVIVELRNNGVDQIWSYFVPSDLQNKISLGCRVKIKFNRQTIVGFVVKIDKCSDDHENLSFIEEVIDFKSFVNLRSLNLVKYLEFNFLSRKVDYLNMFVQSFMMSKKRDVWIPTNLHLLNDEQKKEFDKNGYLLENDEKLQCKKDFIVEEKSRRVKRFIARCSSHEKFEQFFEDYQRNKQLQNIKLLIEDGTKINFTSKMLSKPNLDKLIEHNIVKLTFEEYFYDVNISTSLNEKLLENTLTQQQTKICEQIDLNKYKEYLIHGRTGSGKTHIFIDLINKVNKQGKIAYLLIPEVGLSYKIFEKISKYVDNAFLFHYKVPTTYKAKLVQALEKNEVNVIVGTRSTLFLNNENIGLIIFDEEHDEDYYQNQAPTYDSKVLANVIAKSDNFPIVYGSATPSFELKSRQYKSELKTFTLEQTFNKFQNTFEVVKHSQASGFLSLTLQQQISDRISKDEQTILLFNKKAFAQSLTCSDCGYTDKCPQCGLTRKVYVNEHMLKCTHCSSSKRIYNKCEKCNSNKLTYKGFGIEQVYNQLIQVYDPSIVCVIDAEILNKEKQRAEIMENIENNKYKIILGTQIISKGFDFKNITLGAVLDGDYSLNFPSFDASEKTFQLLNQFIGRVGRHKQGHVIIQTSDVENKIWEQILTSDYDNFAFNELKLRQKYKMPPFIMFGYIKLKDSNVDKLFEKISNIRNFLLSKNVNVSEIYQPFISKQGIFYILEIKITYNEQSKQYISKCLLELKKEFANNKFTIALNPSNWR